MTTIHRTTTPASQAIWLGSAQQPLRTGIVLSLPVPMVIDEIALYAAECEGSIYVFPDGLATGTKHPFVMFQTSAVVVFNPGVTPPDLYPLANWPPPGSAVVSLPMGQDIGLSIPNYYLPISRSGAFQATQDGVYTFVLYVWGGSSGAGTGNAALVYPATSSLTVTVV